MVRTLRSTSTIPMYCSTCMETKEGAKFPSANATKACDHPIKTCTDCMETWIQISLDSKYQPYIECPECDQQLVAAQDLRSRGTVQKRVFEIFARIGRSKLPGWRWCLEEGCEEGGVHENANAAGQIRQGMKEAGERVRKVKFTIPEPAPSLPPTTSSSPSPAPIEIRLSPLPMPMDIDELEPEIWTCHGRECPGQVCITCDRPWHEGETCTEFAWRTMRHSVEDALSKKAVEWLRGQGRIKDCPNCHCPIEKEGPGRDVLCSRCLLRFLWDQA